MTNPRAYAIALFACSFGAPLFAVEHGTLEVVQLNNTNNGDTTATPAVSITVMAGATPNFKVRGHNKGDYNMLFTASAPNDPNLGVMLSSVAQNSRNNSSGGGKNGTSYATSHAEIDGNGFFIPTHATAGSIENAGSEYNINVSAAWFPHSEGWLSAHVKNTADNGTLNTIYSSQAIRLGTEFVVQEDPGIYGVDLTKLHSHGVQATSANGILLVVGGKNEPNFAMSRANADGTFTISDMDNGMSDPLTYEEDGVAFVYIPTVAAGKGQLRAMGRVRSDASTELGGGDFTVSKISAGQWLLKVNGQTAGTGTLIISPEGGVPLNETDPLPNNTNNFISYEWNEASGGWVVQSRDLPSAALQDGATATEPMFSFAFLTAGATVPVPSVAITSPTSSSSRKVGQPLTLTSTATIASPASIVSVEYFVDGQSVGTSTTAPYELSWTPTTLGSHLVEAFATASNGTVGGANRVATTLVPTPQVPGYSAAIFDGGDGEARLTPPAATVTWAISPTTASPLAFDNAGTASGAPVVRINGAAIPYTSGILMGDNYAGDNYSDTATRGAIDNNVVPYDLGGSYALKVQDTSQNTADPAVVPESGRFALGFFPFANGWTGAQVDADLSLPAGSAGLPAGVRFYHLVTGDYAIDGLPTDGNLLAVSRGADSDNVASVKLVGDRWFVTSIDNNGTREDDAFSFLYVPRDARQVLSGVVAENGTLTPLNLDLAAMGATVSVGTLGYEITFGDGSVINPTTAALFVTPDLSLGAGGDNIYSYHAEGNKFVVFSHDLPNVAGTFQNGGFRFLAVPFQPSTAVGTEVSVIATTALATEGGSESSLVFRFTRLGDTSAPLTVSYGISGTATQGADYPALSGTVTFAAGASTTDLVVPATFDMQYEADETVILTLLPGAGYTLSGSAGSSTGTLRNALSLVPVVTVSFQEGVGGYTGQFEKRIGLTTNQLGSAVPSYYLDGYSADPNALSADVNSIMRFANIFGAGAGQIPPGATIVRAELKLTTADGADSRSGGPYVVDRLTQEVDENTTYAALSGGSGFEGARGGSSGSPISAFGNLTNKSVETGDVTEIVRQWNANPSTSYGFSIFAAGTTDGWEYCTVGNGDPTLRPKLVISYVMDSTQAYEFKADRSARLEQGHATTDGSQIVMSDIDLIDNGTREGLFHFPVEFGGDAVGAIPADEEIVRAELVIYTSGVVFATDGGSGNAHSPGPVGAYRMLVDWTPTSTFPVSPVVGQDVAPATSHLTGMGQASYGYMDVTAIVQAWRAGEPNYGLNLKPETADGWQFFWPGATAYEAAVPRLHIVTAKQGSSEPTPFDTWASAHGIAGATATSDADRDGIPAIVEYALGLNPQAASVLPALQVTGDTATLRFVKGAEAAADGRVTYQIQSSADLATWANVAATVNNATEISFSEPVATATGAKKFFRLSVVYTP